MEMQKENANPNEISNSETKTFTHREKSLAAVVLVSFICGMVGGVVGNRYFSLSQSGIRVNQSIPSSQNVTVTEDSGVVDVVKQASPAVVSIVASKDLSKIPGYGQDPFNDPFFFFRSQQPSGPNVQEIGAGSGFFVSADGLILTNKHVVEDEQASYTVITEDGKKFDAKVLARDPINDLSIVKIEIKDAPHLQLADSSKIQVGQRVIAIGNSLGQYQNTVTTGIVSGIGRSITAGSESSSENLQGVIQTDAAINPGNSGGPLLNIAGQVIGINTAIDRQGQLVGFAIPSNDINRSLSSYQQNGKITRPYLGIRYVVITKEMADANHLPKDYGALISRGQNITDFAVIPGSPADKAGLVENDIILEVNGKKIDENTSIPGLLKDYNVGDTITLKVYHKDGEKEVKVTLGEYR